MEPNETSAPPLDYSFKELKSCAEIETEEPRSGRRRVHATAANIGEAPGAVGVAGAAGGTASEGGLDSSMAPSPALVPGKTGGAVLARTGGGMIGATSSATPHFRRVVRKVTVAVKLNNNFIETVRDLPQSLEAAMEDPLKYLMWVDLSFNRLAKIEPTLLQFQNLKALYLHGNRISSLPSSEKLRKLPKLISLTLNGNPIENSPCYRVFVVGALQHLRQLDHSTITEDELLSSRSWFEAHLRRKEKREREREEQLAMMAE